MNFLIRSATIAVVLMCLGNLAEVRGQQDAVQKTDPMEKLAADREKAMIQAIYEKTQTAKTASDYSELIEACRDGMKKKISNKNSKYLKQLEAWGLERRGVCRCDLGKLMFKANSFEQANEIFDKANSDFETSLELNPKSWKSVLGIGLVRAERGDYLAAIETFTQLCESYPKRTEGWFNRAELYYQLERFEKALADYEHVLTILPADLQAITGRGHCLFKTGRFSEALKDYQTVSTLLPNNDSALINIADAEQTLGNWKGAYDAYFAAMTARQTASGSRKAAWLMATCPDPEYNRPEIAIQLAQKAIELEGETSPNLDTLAAAQAANGDYDAARKSQELAIAKVAQASAEQTDRLTKYTNGQPFVQSAQQTERTQTMGSANPLQPKKR